MNEREKLLKRIAAEDFAVIELHMFMDSHPNNKEAAMKLKEHDMKKSNAPEKNLRKPMAL
mgnify:CR=1 FL=1